MVTNTESIQALSGVIHCTGGSLIVPATAGVFRAMRTRRSDGTQSRDANGRDGNYNPHNRSPGNPFLKKARSSLCKVCTRRRTEQ